MKKLTISLILVTALVTGSMSAMAPLTVTAVDFTPAACTDYRSPTGPTGAVSVTVAGGTSPPIQLHSIPGKASPALRVKPLFYSDLRPQGWQRAI